MADADVIDIHSRSGGRITLELAFTTLAKLARELADRVDPDDSDLPMDYAIDAEDAAVDAEQAGR